MMVPLVFRFNHFWEKNHFLNLSKKTVLKELSVVLS
jgi:hypothetical protein